MPMPASGQLQFSEIQAEFEGTHPISLSEYYAAAVGIPASGTISLSSFYGASSHFEMTISTNKPNMVLSTQATLLGWDGTVPIKCTINSGVWVYASGYEYSLGRVPMGLVIDHECELINYGYITGRGGHGGRGGSHGGVGTTALQLNAANCDITNMSGGYIAGGGGGGGGAGGSFDATGGGGGAGGGRGGGGPFTEGDWPGGGAETPGTASGDTLYVNTGSNPGFYTGGYGGGAGGGGALGWPSQENYGAGGGMILPGVGGAGNTNAAGGSAGGAGSDGSGTQEGGGGGGWGAAGGDGRNANSGKAGGAAIDGAAYTLTNNGIIYGST